METTVGGGSGGTGTKKKTVGMFGGGHGLSSAGGGRAEKAVDTWVQRVGEGSKDDQAAWEPRYAFVLWVLERRP